jgi:hypothetical protein
MKSNVTIMIFGVLVLTFFLLVPPNDLLVSILFGFSAVGIGCTIKFLILNVPKLINQKVRI